MLINQAVISLNAPFICPGLLCYNYWLHMVLISHYRAPAHVTDVCNNQYSGTDAQQEGCASMYFKL